MMSSVKKSLYSLSKEELIDVVVSLGEKKYRAKQIYEDLITTRVQSIADIDRIPKKFRELLASSYTIFDMVILDKKSDNSRSTVKFLFKTRDNYGIEAVLLKYSYGYSICISTQVGCNMGCDFCASTKNGKKRDLTVDEMIQQIAFISVSEGVKISNVVLMGIGEPLDNYDNVLGFLKTVTREDHLNFSMRKITVSTCGIVPKIYDLADEKLQITLAVSLHHPYDADRSRVMPINSAYSIAELNTAIDYYIKKTSRRVSIEYALIDGVNDSMREADKLVSMYKGKLVHINLIPLNKVEDSKHRASTKKNVEMFLNRLNSRGINATIRREMGGSDDVSAACGQLVAITDKLS